MFCPRCGKEIKDNTNKFCIYCGIPLQQNQQPNQQYYPQPPQYQPPPQYPHQQPQFQPYNNKSSSGCLIVVVFFVIQIVNIFISYLVGKQIVEDRSTSSVANVIKYELMTKSEINHEIFIAAIMPFLIIFAISMIICTLIHVLINKK